MDQVTTYARTRSQSCRKLNDELFVGAADRDTVFGMNAVAEFVWDAVDSRESNLDSIVGAVCREFDVSPDVAAQDVRAFLDELVALKAVHVK